jgi:hypothetical protein
MIAALCGFAGHFQIATRGLRRRMTGQAKGQHPPENLTKD